MSKKFRRILAMILTISMVVSMVGAIPVFATNTGSQGQIKGESSPVYHVVDAANTEITDTSLTTGPVSQKIYQNENESGASVEISKSIEGTTTPNEFEITLEVKTTENVQENVISPDAAVVLVIDNSSSMYQTINGSYGGSDTAPNMTQSTEIDGVKYAKAANGQLYGNATKYPGEGFYPYNYDAYEGKVDEYGRIVFVQNGRVPQVTNGNWSNNDLRFLAARQAALDFVNTFTADAGDAKRYISIVSYSNDGVVEQTWTTNKQDAIDAINDIQPVANTNTDGGLTAALAMLDSDHTSLPTKYQGQDSSLVENIDNRYVVLLADGDCNKSADDSTGEMQNDDNTNQAKATAKYITDLGVTLYTVAFALDSSTLKTMATDGCYYTSTSSVNLSEDLEKIVTQIKNLANAWTVTDPMGSDYIVLDHESLGDDTRNSVAIDDDKKGFVWNLKTSDFVETGTVKNKTYTYTLKYNVTLDTAAEHFEENTYYLTNQNTFLKYYFYSEVTTGGVTSSNADDIYKTLDFNVPAVKGEIPQVEYIVNHYWQTGVDSNDTFIYELHESNDPISVKLWTEFGAQEVQDFQNTYENYTFNPNTADPANGTQITPTDNVIDLYYTRDTTSATVNHYYYTVDTQNNTIAVKSDSHEVVTSVSPCYIGDPYEARTANKTGYTQITATPGADGSYTKYEGGNQEIILQKEADKNVVNYYYVKTTDSRTDVNVTVNHHYTTYKWELKAVDDVWDYVLVEDTTDNSTGTAVSQKYGTPFTAAKDTREDYYTFLSDETTSTGSDFTKDTLKFDSLTVDSTVDLYYEYKPATPDAQLVDVIVNHVYSAEKTYIDIDGNKKTTTVAEGSFEQEFFKEYYVGETFTATERTEHTVKDEVNTYTKSSATPDMAIELIAGQNVITIYYTRDNDLTIPTDVKVVHTYFYYEQAIGEDGQPYYKDPEISDPSITVEPEGDFYVDQYYTATELVQYNEKTYTPCTIYTTTNDTVTLSDKKIQLENGNNVVTIHYELKDNLGPAAINVTHAYYTYTYSYENGAWVERITGPEYGTPVLANGVDGQSYTVTEVFDFDGETYSRMDANSLSATFDENNPNQTIPLSYKREVRVLTDAGVTVNHQYFTTETYINEAGEKVTETREDTDINYSTGLIETVDGNQLYGGESYSATADLKDELYLLDTLESDSLHLTLEANKNNEINLVYHRTLDTTVKTSVQVIHHYHSESTTLQDGKPYVQVDNLIVEEGIQTNKYVGQFFTATPDNRGSYTQLTEESTYTDVQLGTQLTTINIYYEKFSDVTVPATLDVTHIYTTKYASGKADDVNTSYDEQVKSWATVKHVFNVDTMEDLYEVVDIDSTNSSVDKADYSIVLEEGSNAVVINYVRYEDDITETAVSINHYYSTYDKYSDVTTNDGNTSTTYVAVVEDGTYTADLVEDYGDYSYDYTTGEQTITIDADPTLNVINLYYVREIDTTPDEPDVPDEPDTPNPPSTTYYTLIVNWVDEDGNALADQEKTTRLRYSSKYETEQKEFDGYTFLMMAEDSDPISGTMKGNREVTYVYTPVSDVPETDIPLVDPPEDPTTPDVDIPTTEIPNVDVPLTDIPDEDVPLTEIPDMEIPLGDTPDTGDTRTATTFLLTAALSAAGLVWLLKMELDEKKKRKQSEQ